MKRLETNKISDEDTNLEEMEDISSVIDEKSEIDNLSNDQ